ncbi:hypothetical protein C9374_001313 [Naegleria lovaniensis]|uniref:Uncharacterized protein n=1 Tax=Naegleria lovaniensis TaxID=51637 RepID=A0AA88GX55_NAELO|nr:uncharacterized protein C9374_001313 [Naegleria lovaniensis]KAG2387719.1 hypothetical protein C9374_001313 [Naegleria lovaniensis]
MSHSHPQQSNTTHLFNQMDLSGFSSAIGDHILDLCGQKDEPYVVVKISFLTYQRLLAMLNGSNSTLNNSYAVNTNTKNTCVEASCSGSTSMFKGGQQGHAEYESDDMDSTEKKSTKGDAGVVKGSWSEQEDEKLLQLVKKHGPKRWSFIASQLEGRVGKQCRERYLNHLDPRINKKAWTEEEDRIIIELHEKHGNQWAKISKALEGRTANAIKNHWNSTLSKRFEKKTKTKKDPSEVKIDESVQSQHVIHQDQFLTEANVLAQSRSECYRDHPQLSCKSSEFNDLFLATPLADSNPLKRSFRDTLEPIDDTCKKFKRNENDIKLESEETLNVENSADEDDNSHQCNRKDKFKNLRINLVEKSGDTSSDRSSSVICHTTSTPTGIEGAVSVLTEHTLPTGFTPRFTTSISDNQLTFCSPTPSGLSSIFAQTFNDGSTPSNLQLPEIFMDEMMFVSPKNGKNG